MMSGADIAPKILTAAKLLAARARLAVGTCRSLQLSKSTQRVQHVEENSHQTMKG